jgi:hypothetical protein
MPAEVMTHLESLEDHSDVHREQHYTGKPEAGLRWPLPLLESSACGQTLRSSPLPYPFDPH